VTTCFRVIPDVSVGQKTGILSLAAARCQAGGGFASAEPMAAAATTAVRANIRTTHTSVFRWIYARRLNSALRILWLLGRLPTLERFGRALKQRGALRHCPVSWVTTEGDSMTKLFGKYRGRVESNADPESLGRLQISSPDVFGDESPRWALPCLPYSPAGSGFLMLPEVGSPVWIEFEEGDPDRPVWVGCSWETCGAPALDPAAVVVSTAGGHRVVLGDSNAEITVVHAGGATVTLSAAGTITIAAPARIDLTAPTITLEAGMVKASGVFECDTLIAKSVVAESYTPGAGNIW
jgi:Type VI secretion system/phage-baseplate injector OB domain